MTILTFSGAKAALEALGSSTSETENGFLANCPAHDDKNPSLSVSPADIGDSALFHCFAGCSFDAVRAALSGAPASTSNNAPRSEKVAAKAAPAKKAPKIKGQRQKAAEYIYTDYEGNPLWKKVRFNIIDGGAVVGKTFMQQDMDGNAPTAIIAEYRDSEQGTPIYNLPAVYDAASAGGEIIVAEGEKDCDLLNELGFVATTTFAGAASKIDEASWWALEGASRVVIIADRDEIGYKGARATRDFLRGLGHEPVVLRTPLDIDKSDFYDHHEAGLGFDELEPVPAELMMTEEEKGLAGASWAPYDLEAILSGEYQPEEPAIMARADGQNLLYAGKVHSFHGESESGKSMIAQAEAARQIMMGHKVLYIDFEDSPASVVGRLMGIFRATPDAIRKNFHYVQPQADPISGGYETAAWEDLLMNNYSLVVLDGVTEALSLSGKATKENDDVTTWMRQVPHRIARETGAAVVLIDHVTKSTDGRGRFAIGAQAKMASIDGVAYAVDVVSPMGRGLKGQLKISVGKDRPGSVRGHCGPANGKDRLAEAARFTLDSTDPDNPAWELTAWEGAEADQDWDYLRAIKVFNIVERLGKEQELTYKALEAEIGGSKAKAKLTVDQLTENGYLIRSLKGKSHIYSVHPTKSFYKGQPLVREGMDSVPHGMRFNEGLPEADWSEAFPEDEHDSPATPASIFPEAPLDDEWGINDDLCEAHIFESINSPVVIKCSQCNNLSAGKAA